MVVCGDSDLEGERAAVEIDLQHARRRPMSQHAFDKQIPAKDRFFGCFERIDRDFRIWFGLGDGLKQEVDKRICVVDAMNGCAMGGLGDEVDHIFRQAVFNCSRIEVSFTL